MTAFQQFLKEKLAELSQRFPGVCIRYAHSPKIEAHVIELTPQREYYKNTTLDEAWMVIVDTARVAFPYEEIVFISDDSLLAVDTAEMEWLVVQQETAVFGFADAFMNAYQNLVVKVGRASKGHHPAIHTAAMTGIRFKPQVGFAQVSFVPSETLLHHRIEIDGDGDWVGTQQYAQAA